MKARRERLIDKAFPNLQKQFNEIAKKQPPWLALFDVLGKRPIDDPTRRVRIVKVMTGPLPMPNPPRPSSCQITQTTGTVLPHMRIRTVVTLEEADLVGLASSAPAANRKVTDWAELALKTANRVLFFNLEQRSLDVKDHGSCTLATLPAAVQTARPILQGYAMALVVSEGRHREVIRDGALHELVRQALKGGIVAPVAELPDSKAYILRQGAGDAVVEMVHELELHWDFGNADTVELIALQEFVLVAETPIPAYELKFDDTT